jgi:hypothetical protein
MNRNELPLGPHHHRVRPKRLMSLGCVWRKSCTYLAPILAPSPNRLKQHLTWPTSPRCSIGCVQNNLQAYGTIVRKLCTYLASRLALCPNGTKWAYTWDTTPRRTIGFGQRLQTNQNEEYLSCFKIRTISNQTEMSFPWASSPRNTIGCVQNDF